MGVFLFVETLVDRRRHRCSLAIAEPWGTDTDGAVLKKWITARACVAAASENTYPERASRDGVWRRPLRIAQAHGWVFSEP